jgi:hypothetical protein
VLAYRLFFLKVFDNYLFMSPSKHEKRGVAVSPARLKIVTRAFGWEYRMAHLANGTRLDRVFINSIFLVCGLKSLFWVIDSEH